MAVHARLHRQGRDVWASFNELRGGAGVQRSDFREGQRWALRTSRVPGGEAVKVRLVAYPQGVRKVKVVHEGGELDGMDEWVNPTALIVPWSQWSKPLAVEKRKAELRHHVGCRSCSRRRSPGNEFRDRRGGAHRTRNSDFLRVEQGETVHRSPSRARETVPDPGQTVHRRPRTTDRIQARCNPFLSIFLSIRRQEHPTWAQRSCCFAEPAGARERGATSPPGRTKCPLTPWRHPSMA